MPHFFRSFACSLLALSLCPVSAWAFGVRVECDNVAVKENVEALISPIRDSSTAQVRQAYRAGIAQAARRGIQALGYYRFHMRFRWEEAADRDPQKATLVADIELGDPVHIREAQLALAGEAREDRAFNFLKRRLPKEGRQLNHGEYEDFKTSVENLALGRGYFDGKFTRKELGVDAEKNEAYWWLDYDSGPRYKMADVQFVGSQIRPEILQNLVPFEEGEPYRASYVSELNRRLTQTGWFGSVVVSPMVSDGKKDPEHRIPVRAEVAPKSSNIVQTGLGYSTDVGPQGKVSWTKPWLNDSGHSLEVSTELSAYEQLADLTYKIPLERNALEEYYLVQGGFKREDLNDTKSNSMTMLLSRNWDREEGWKKAVNLRFSLDSFDQGLESHDTMLIYPGVSFSRTRSRGGMMAHWGDSQRYTVNWSSEYWGSDVDFIVAEAQHVLIRSAAFRHRFIWRSRLGWMQTDDFEKVPPDLRFFAGGDRSVRGYDYESISPKDSEGNLTGAEKLITASIEYQYRVTGRWWGAVFFDAGDAMNNISDIDIKKGVGVGIRWESPLGAVRLDIARPVGDPNEHGWQFYIGLGPEL
ncbi:MAG TPA: outer membrane protein assembly factor [Candidatus Aphodousia gallistercoris]|nr:outer membrane protein assembly factor [Candidatus Aphodousia gallistercoris]